MFRPGTKLARNVLSESLKVTNFLHNVNTALSLNVLYSCFEFLICGTILSVLFSNYQDSQITSQY